MFLQIISSCNDPGLSSILGVVRRMLNLIQIIAPILLLLMTAINLTKLMKDPDDKKLLNKVKNSALAAVLIFFIPMFVNVLMGMMGESTTFSSCWNNATVQVSGNGSGSGFMDPYGSSKKKSTIYDDPSDYQNGGSSTNKNNTGSTYRSSGSTTTNNSNYSGTGNNKEGVNNAKANRVVFIGDSRTVQMYAYLNGDWNGANYSSGGVHEVGNDIYVAEGAMGLQWMKSTGIPVANRYFTSGTAIVILMGVNDLSNVNNYINYVNQNSSSWKTNGSSLYYVSVNPCDGNYAYLNSSIESFNSNIRNQLNNSVGYIDTYNVIKNNFSTTDGLHYDKSTYQAIYNYIKSIV